MLKIRFRNAQVHDSFSVFYCFDDLEKRVTFDDQDFSEKEEVSAYPGH